MPRPSRALMAVVGLALGASCSRGHREPAPPVGASPAPANAVPIAVEPTAPTTPPPRYDAPFTVSLGQNGQIRLRRHHVDLLRLEYPFFGAGWTWADPTVDEGGVLGDRTRFVIDIPGLDARVEAVARRAEPGVLEVRYTIDLRRDLPDIIGGGPEFHLLRHAVASAPGQADPQLLPDDTGFSWQVAQGETVTVRFDPPLPRVYFERGRPEQIRAFMLTAGAKAGQHTFTMRVELPADGAVLPSTAQRYAGGRKARWFASTLEWDRSPVDLRYLNDGHRPAGIHGPVKAVGDALQFADGTAARFWGTNVTAMSLYAADRDTVKAQARRIAAMGFNLVRLHHHDTDWVEPNVFVQGAPDTQQLSDDALAKLDWWVKCLQDEGIYVWLDLHVGRRLREGDRVPGFTELPHSQDDVKGFGYVNPRIEALMQDFARRYLTRVNRHTGRRYTDDPGVLGVLVTNENDLTHHFGNTMNDNAGAPTHREMLRKAAAPFMKAHRLPKRALQPWTYGPAKVLMNEIEARWHLRMIDALRTMGFSGPVATTNFWGDDPMASLPALTVGDVLDIHGYGGEGELEGDPRHAHNFLSRIAAGRVEGMPITITEWNLLPPVRDRFVGPIWFAAVASLQGWDAPMHFCYTNTALPLPGWLHPGQGLIDPATMALMPAAALIFREGHAAPARERYRLVMKRDDLYGRVMGAPFSAAIRTLTERSRVEIALPNLPELAWDGRHPPRPGAIEVHDIDRSFIPDDATAVVSDTGQLRRDWSRGFGTLDSPRSQAAYGWIGGQRIALQDIELDIDTPNATVVVSATDGKPIAESEDLLLTVTSEVETTGGRPPLRARAVTGTVRIRSEHATLTMRPVTTGSKAAARHAGAEQVGTRSGEHHQFRLFALPTHWYRITIH